MKKLIFCGSLAAAFMMLVSPAEARPLDSQPSTIHHTSTTPTKPSKPAKKTAIRKSSHVKTKPTHVNHLRKNTAHRKVVSNHHQASPRTKPAPLHKGEI